MSKKVHYNNAKTEIIKENWYLNAISVTYSKHNFFYSNVRFNRVRIFIELKHNILRQKQDQ